MRLRKKFRRKKIRPYLKQFIVKVPIAEQFEFEPDGDPDVHGVYDELKRLKIQFYFRVAGTKNYNGRKLWLGAGFCNKPQLKAIIDDFGLDWTIAAYEGNPLVQNRVLNLLNPDIDENGDEVTITDCTGRLTTIAGHNWTY